MLTFRLLKTLPPFRLDVELATTARRLVLFGPSGSGKSLTVQCLAGLVRPDRGFVETGTRCLFDSSRAIDLTPEKRRVGYVPQGGAVFPHLSVAANVGYGLRRLPASVRDARVRQLLALVRLEDYGARRPDQLSGGEQQRVAVARALAIEPELLLLDEPFSALDAPVRGLLRQELLELQTQLGFAWVFVTHDLEEAYLLGDEIAVYDRGRILQSGPRDEVFYRPRTTEVARLVAIQNIIPVIAVSEDRVRIEGTSRQLKVAAGMGARGVASFWACIRQEDIHIVGLDRGASDANDGTPLAGTVVEERHRGVAVSLRFASDSPSAPLHLWVEVTAQVYRSLGLAEKKSWDLLIPSQAVHLIPRGEMG